MSFAQPPTLYQNQSDALLELLTNDPYFTKSSVPALNKALNTSHQNVIGAINELLSTITAINSTVSVSLDQDLAVIGDFTSNPGLVTSLQQIDTNMLAAIIKLYAMIVGDPNNPINIAGTGTSLNGAILALQNQINSVGTAAQIYSNYKQIIFAAADGTTQFPFDYIPIEHTIAFFVNGSLYDGDDCYTFDQSTNVLTWVNTADNGGFDIDAGDKAVILYNFYMSDNPTFVLPPNKDS